MKIDHPPIQGYGKAPSSTDHKMFCDQVKQHGAGYAHHSSNFMKHSAGHQYEQDKAKAMCGGGYTKGK